MPGWFHGLIPLESFTWSIFNASVIFLAEAFSSGFVGIEVDMISPFLILLSPFVIEEVCS